MRSQNNGSGLYTETNSTDSMEFWQWCLKEVLIYVGLEICKDLNRRGTRVEGKRYAWLGVRKRLSAESGDSERDID
jgi:hypothetical protein